MNRPGAIAGALESAFARYHRRAFIEKDPLDRVLRYARCEDREVVGLLAATLAFGRVAHILASLDRVLDRLGPSPAAFVREAGGPALARAVRGCRHRWVTGDAIANLLVAAGRMLRRHGRLGASWSAARRETDADTHDTLARWIAEWDRHGLRPGNALVPRPERRSAAKRLHLYLRWMIRRDPIDPGGWSDSPARLLVPLDVHMHRIARRLGFTRRRSADLAAAREVTAGFRLVDPSDPVRFDFALTRPGIRDGDTLAPIRDALIREGPASQPVLARRAAGR